MEGERRFVFRPVDRDKSEMGRISHFYSAVEVTLSRLCNVAMRTVKSIAMILVPGTEISNYNDF